MTDEEKGGLPAKRELSSEELERRSLELKDDVRENIQTLHGFIMVLAIGNAMRELAVSHANFFAANPSQITPEITYEGAATFSIGLILIFRFFLGDRLYIKRYKPNNLALFIVDMLNIFISAILIAYLSFFVTQPAYMLYLATILIFLEVVWWIIRSIIAWLINLLDGQSSNIPDDEKLGINIGTVIAVVTLGLVYLKSQFDGLEIGLNPLEWPAQLAPLFVSSELPWLLQIFLLNTALDLLLKGPGYFGSPQDWIISVGRRYK